MDNVRTGLYGILEQLDSRLRTSGCKVVTFGDTPDYAQEKNIVTPSAHIGPSAFNVLTIRTSSISFEVFIYGQIAFEQGGERKEPSTSIFGQDGNTVDVMHESMMIAENLVKGMLDETIHAGGGIYITLDGSPTFTPVYVEGNDKVAGVIGTIQMSYTNHACNVK